MKLETLKREEFRKQFDSLMSRYTDLDDLKLQIELKALIQSSNIDISFPYKDTLYEDIIELLKNFDIEVEPKELGTVVEPKFVTSSVKSVDLQQEKKLDYPKKDYPKKDYQKKYNPRYKKFNKHKKVYKDEYEADRDFKLNIYKKNLYATPYFQEKKRRNTFNFNKSKPKDKSGWKKKGKMHQK